MQTKIEITYHKEDENEIRFLLAKIQFELNASRKTNFLSCATTLFKDSKIQREYDYLIVLKKARKRSKCST
jgi:hypothetical protein